MAKIVCITSGLTGIVHASFELVSRLTEAGHKVIYMCPWDIEKLVKAQGFDYIQLPKINFQPTPDIPNFRGLLARPKRILYKIINAKKRRQEGIEALNTKFFEQLLYKEQPDLILADVEVQELIVTACAIGVPTAIISPWFSTWKRPKLPPFNQEIIPGEGWKGSKLYLEYLWLRQKLFIWRIVQERRLATVKTDRYSLIKAYAKQKKIPTKLLDPYSFPYTPCHFRKLPVLSMNAWEMEFPHERRKSHFYVGPMVYSRRKDINLSEGVEADLEQIFSLKVKLDKKLIFCSMSSKAQGDVSLLKKIIQAVEQNFNWLLIIGLGAKFAKDSLEPFPSNVYAFFWTPTLQILKHADCAIITAGVNTINECIFSRVPMLVFSLKVNDQSSCAARIKYHKLGITADKDYETKTSIYESITSLLGDTTYQKNVNKMADIYEKTKTDKLLIHTINRILEGKTSSQ